MSSLARLILVLVALMLALSACVDSNNTTEAPIDLMNDQSITDGSPPDGGEPCLVDSDCELSQICDEEGKCVIDPDYSPGEELDLEAVESGAGLEHQPVGAVLGEYCDVFIYSNGTQGGTCCFSESYGSSPFGYNYQCTEFCFRFLCEIHNINNCRYTGQVAPYGHAKYWYENHYDNEVLAALDRYPNGGSVAPQAGDVIVFDGEIYGHVAIVREVQEGVVILAEQNVTSTAVDAGRSIVLHHENGTYSIKGALGWMRVPGAAPGCGIEMPQLSLPVDQAHFEQGSPILFSWILGADTENHFFKLRHLESDAVVMETNTGLLGGYSYVPTLVGTYRWTVYYKDESCEDGECLAEVWHFSVGEQDIECPASECESCDETFCQGDQVITCSCDGQGCPVESGRVTCTEGCFEGACSNCEDPTYDEASFCNGQELWGNNLCGDSAYLQECAYSCSDGQCLAPSRALSVTPGLNQWTPDFIPNTDCSCAEEVETCKKLYRLRTIDIDGNTATIQAEKADTGGGPSVPVHYWIVVHEEDSASCTQINSYTTRVEGTWAGGTLEVSFPVFPSESAYEGAQANATKHISLITGGGGGHENERIWLSDTLTFEVVLN